MPAAEADRPTMLEVELQFMGYYKEKNIKFQVNLVELANCGGNIMYEMNFDAPSGNWTVVAKIDTNRDIIGVAEFTQHAPPEPTPASPRGQVTGSPVRNAAAAGRSTPNRDPMHNARGVSASPKRDNSRSTSPKGAAAAGAGRGAAASGAGRGGAASPKAAVAGGRGSPKSNAAAAGNANVSPKGRGRGGVAR